MAQTDSQIVRPGRSTIADGLASQLLAQHVASRIQCWARASPPGVRHARWKGRDRGWQATLNVGGWPKRETAVRPGTAGVLICPIVSGEQCARTTPRAARPGIISLTITRAREPIAGARTGCSASP